MSVLKVMMTCGGVGVALSILSFDKSLRQTVSFQIQPFSLRPRHPLHLTRRCVMYVCMYDLLLRVIKYGYLDG